jgi:hypothetical protein
LGYKKFFGAIIKTPGVIAGTPGIVAKVLEQ